MAAVLPAELRRAFITDAVAGAGYIQTFIDHQPPSFLQSQLFLILQRQRREHADVSGCIEQAHESQHRLKQRLVNAIQKQTALWLVRYATERRIGNKPGDLHRVEIQTNT